MEERKVTEKRTEVHHEEKVEKKPGVTNVNVGSDGSVQTQQEEDVVDDPVGTTTVREETRIEEKKSR